MLILLLFFEAKKEVGHFYCDPVLPKEDQSKTISALEKQLQDVLDQAIWQPTPHNVLRYMKVQKILMDKSEQFANTWMTVLISHPEFDPTVKNPTSYYGSLHVRASEEKKSAGQLKKTYEGLCFVFGGRSW